MRNTHGWYATKNVWKPLIYSVHRLPATSYNTPTVYAINYYKLIITNYKMVFGIITHYVQTTKQSINKKINNIMCWRLERRYPPIVQHNIRKYKNIINFVLAISITATRETFSDTVWSTNGSLKFELNTLYLNFN